MEEVFIKNGRSLRRHLRQSPPQTIFERFGSENAESGHVGAGRKAQNTKIEEGFGVLLIFISS